MVLLIELIVSIVLLIFSISTIVFSINIGMESRYELVIGPGIFPLVLAGALTFFSIIWIIEIIKKAGLKGILTEIKNIIPFFISYKQNLINFVILFVAAVCYIFLLIPWLGFTTSTIIFFLVSVLYFGKIGIFKTIILVVPLSFFIKVFFENILNVPLP